jgi:hypothetical protein
MNKELPHRLGERAGTFVPRVVVSGRTNQSGKRLHHLAILRRLPSRLVALCRPTQWSSTEPISSYLSSPPDGTLQQHLDEAADRERLETDDRGDCVEASKGEWPGRSACCLCKLQSMSMGRCSRATLCINLNTNVRLVGLV